MKYIKEYSKFINEGYVDLPKDLMVKLGKAFDIFSTKDYDCMDDLIESFDSIFSKFEFPCPIVLINSSDSDMYNSDDDILRMKGGTKYNLSKDNFIIDAGLNHGDNITILAKRDGTRHFKSEHTIYIDVYSDFINIYKNKNTINSIKNIIMHELGHFNVFNKIVEKYISNYFLSNPDINQLLIDEDVSKFLHAYKIKNLNTPDIKNLKHELFLNSDLMTDMTDVLNQAIQDIRDDGYPIKSIVDFKNGPFTLDKYKKIFTKYNKDEQNILKYLIQATFDSTLRHDLSREEFAVDVTSITSELLMYNPDISVAIDIVAKSSKPNTPSNTFNHYLHVAGNKTKEFNIIRKMIYLNLQNIANNLNVKILTNSGVKLLK